MNSLKLTVLVASILSIFSLQVLAQETQPLKIALNLPLSGALAVYGQSIEEGVRTAVQDEEENSKLVDFDFEDNAGKAAEAVKIANEQLLKHPDIYVSGIKPQLMAIKDIIEKSQIPHFQWVFDANIRPNGEKVNFRTWVNFKDEPQVFIEFAKKIQPKKVAIIYVSLPHTDEEYNKIIIPGLKLLGIEDIYVQPYQMDLTDFSALVLNIRGYKPDLLILSGFSENLASMVKRLHEQNLIQNKNVIATYDMIDAAALVKHEWIEGIKVATPKFLNMKDSDSKIKGWSIKFKELYGKEANYTNAYAYDMGKIIIEASRIKRANPNRSLTDILQNINIQGLTSSLNFNEFGDLPLSIERGVIKSGSVVKDGE